MDGLDLILVARPPVLTARFDEIGQAYEQLLRRAGAWQSGATG